VTVSSNLEPLNPRRGDTRTALIILSGFTAALFWWIGIAGVANTGGGAQVFLTVPVLATIGTVLLASRRGRQKAKHVNPVRSPKATHASQPQSRQDRGTRPVKRTSLVVLCGFTAALFWWIGIAGIANTGGGAQVFLAIPLLATIGTVLVARHQGPGYRKAAS
jgi:cellobiose-specific phosphotransferase system component IIC